MEIVLTDRYAELFVFLNGLAIIFYLGAIQQKKKRAISFGNYETLEKVTGNSFIQSSNFVLLLRLLGLTALLVGISNPVVIENVPSSNPDYVVGIDSSSSMLAEDLDPNRFGAAKSISNSFVDSLSEETGVGVISFSGQVNPESDIIADKDATQQAINDIQIGEQAGTAIGDAIISSTSMLLGKNSSGAVVLVTDGRNNIGSSVNESIVFAKNNNATVYPIGIGSSREQSERSEFANITNGSQAEFPNLDTRQLTRIANETGGRFIPVTTNSEFEAALTKVSSVEKRTDISRHLIILASVILLIEWLLAATRFSVIP